MIRFLSVSKSTAQTCHSFDTVAVADQLPVFVVVNQEKHTRTMGDDMDT